ncbi:hypothetical protein RA307_30030 [Xanthobacteraceae bacterium Astr-EGSB]|uniref:hypothetical protein n=1 Tax=Astrobacterium formosum TaxID=3069710 RepID=UPI0027B622EB|nr:hypothetical protein [Xanthobacteraceae bacterium Astr-EGSB]
MVQAATEPDAIVACHARHPPFRLFEQRLPFAGLDNDEFVDSQKPRDLHHATSPLVWFVLSLDAIDRGHAAT